MRLSEEVEKKKKGEEDVKGRISKLDSDHISMHKYNIEYMISKRTQHGCSFICEHVEICRFVPNECIYEKLETTLRVLLAQTINSLNILEEVIKIISRCNSKEGEKRE